MATAGDGRAPYESRGDGEKSRQKHCRPEIEEEPQDVSQEAGRINSSGVPDQRVISASISVTVGIPELEQMLKQMTFTRSEIQRLTVLLHSRASDDVEKDATLVPITPTPLPQNPTTIENLPGDLLLKVFIRLMARRLAQMRCVSKYWNFLLSQPSFIKSHLHRSINNNNQILVVFYNSNRSRNNRKVFTPYLSRSPHLKLANFIKLPRVKPGSGHTYRMIKIIGSVHGLICSCYDDHRTIHIWNPSLRAVLTLPPYSFPYYRCHEIFLRFGYDPKTDDYKVVKITGLTKQLDKEQASSEDDEDGVPSFDYVIKKWLEVEIYSMRTGSWKIITERFPSHITRMFNKDDVCVDGHDGRIHWIGHANKKLDSKMIVAFDLSSETFREMTLPDPIPYYGRSNTLGIFGGKLCVTSRDGESEIEVWVMEEYGVAESWVKHHILHFSHYLGYAVNGFTSRDEFLIEDGDDDHLVLYDPTADKAIILEKYLPDEKCITDRIVEYVDSLVWIAPPMT